METRDDVRIREVRAADAPSLVALFEDWDHPLTAPEIGERLTVWATTARAAVLVAEREGRLAGLVAVAARPQLARAGSVAHLVALVVGRDHRRRGVGQVLVAAAEDRAREWGCDRLELTSSRRRVEAHEFYPALGYEDASGRQARYVREL